jgi:hypothetical protein
MWMVSTEWDKNTMKKCLLSTWHQSCMMCCWVHFGHLIDERTPILNQNLYPVWPSLKIFQLIQSLLVRNCMFQGVHKPLHLPYWVESQINCTTYDSFVHMGCHILSTAPLDSISWATSSALLDGEPNKLHYVVGFFRTYRLSHFVNDLLGLQIMSYSVCRTGWKAK